MCRSSNVYVDDIDHQIIMCRSSNVFVNDINNQINMRRSNNAYVNDSKQLTRWNTIFFSINQYNYLDSFGHSHLPCDSPASVDMYPDLSFSGTPQCRHTPDKSYS